MYTAAVPFFVKLPDSASLASPPDDPHAAHPERYLNIINGSTTFAQRELRRGGYASYEIGTSAALCALCELVGSDGGAITFFDVGANAGPYTLLIQGLWRDARVVAFEPAPHTRAWLEKLLISNGLTARVDPAAVSSDTGDAQLHLSSWSDAFHSLDPNMRDQCGSVPVRCVTLDAACKAHDAWPHIVKISVETQEHAVLRGAGELVARHRPFLIVEVLERAGEAAARQITEQAHAFADYVLYRIDDATPPAEHADVQCDARSRDWLLSPRRLDDGFVEAWSRWHRRLAGCRAATNVASHDAARMLELADHARQTGDEEAARGRYEQAAALGSGRAYYHLGRLAENAGRYDVSIARYREGAMHDDRASTRAMARAYELGRGVRADPVEERRWLERAVSLGDRRSAMRLATLMAQHEPAAAQRWFERAAQLGEHKAYYYLGRYQEDAQSYERSLGYYRAGDQLGVVSCTRGLARAYELGRGVEVDMAEARRLLEKGVRMNDAQAAMKLAELGKR